MKDNAIVFLTCSRKESRYVYQRYDRNIECIAETNETCTLTRCVTIEYTSQILRLISNDTYRLSVEAGETDDDILCIIFREQVRNTMALSFMVLNCCMLTVKLLCLRLLSHCVNPTVVLTS